jgi:Ca2+-binding RTX toxin-like protein
MARTYRGSAGNDTITGAQNSEDWFLDFGQGSDHLTGGNRNDKFVLTVDEFRDRVDGGNGVDTVDYTNADRGVTVDLHNGITTAKFFFDARPVEGGNGGLISGWEEKIVTDLHSIENVVGSQYNDIIVGDAGNNRIEGGGGADYINGGEGRDTVSYEHSAHGVTVSLDTPVRLGIVDGRIPGQGNGGDAEGDRLVSIENVVGSAHDDVIIGNREDNVFTGGAGSDTFVFRHAIGHDTIKDFDANGNDHDFLQLDDYFRDFNELREHAEAHGNDVVITIDEHNSITLENVRLSHLDASDFHFL